MDSNVESNSTAESSAEYISTGSQMFFYIFLLLDIPSILCCSLLFYYFIRIPELHQQHYSHQMMIYLLINSFLIIAIDIPLMLPYLQGYYYITTMTNPSSFCLFWKIFDYSMCSLNL